MDEHEAVRRAVARLAQLHGQRAVAEAAGVTQSAVSRFLAGQYRLSMRFGAGLIAAYPDLRALVHAALDAAVDEGAACAAS